METVTLVMVACFVASSWALCRLYIVQGKTSVWVFSWWCEKWNEVEGKEHKPCMSVIKGFPPPIFKFPFILIFWCWTRTLKPCQCLAHSVWGSASRTRYGETAERMEKVDLLLCVFFLQTPRLLAVLGGPASASPFTWEQWHLLTATAEFSSKFPSLEE